VSALRWKSCAGLVGPRLAQNLDRALSFGTVNLSANFAPDPYVANLTAGRQVLAERLDRSSCVGSIANAPDARLDYRTGGALRLYVSAAFRADVTLAPELPGGQSVCKPISAAQSQAVVFSPPQSAQCDTRIGH
jgi:hypothetical protein